MERKSISFDVGFADAELVSYTREADSLAVVLLAWNAERLQLNFHDILAVLDTNLGDVSDLCQVIGDSELLLDSLQRQYEGAVPADHPYKHYQLLDKDECPALKVIAGSIDIKRA